MDARAAQTYETLAHFDLVKALPGDEERAEDVGVGPWRFLGIASDESQDVEGDSILRRSLDLSYADSRGFVNWEHSSEPEHQIGYLTKAELIRPGDIKRLEKDLGIELSKTASVLVEGELYKYSSKAEHVANLLKSAPAGKGLGLSLQGALARDPENGDVLKAFVRGVAVTAVPAHPRTLAQLAKSLEKDLTKSPDPADVPDVIRGYVDAKVEELRRAIQGEPPVMIPRDEALLVIMRRHPSISLATAEKVYDFVSQKES